MNSFRASIVASPIFGILLACLLATGCFRAPPPEYPAHDTLLRLMNERLALMTDVARWKWNTKTAIADPVREQAFLDAMATAGKPYGLDPATTRAFFSTQIEAAKRVQESRFRAWSANRRGPFAEVPNLQRDIRPEIDRISQAMLPALAAALQEPVDETDVLRLADQRLTAPGLTIHARTTARQFFASAAEK